MAFEEHKQRTFSRGNPYADYEYVNKGSRQPWRGLMFAVLFAFVTWGFAWMRWHDMERAEQTGSTLSMSSLEWGLYKVGGKWAVPVLFILFGALFIYLGIRNYFHLQKMKES
jgi:hypothetical protein